MGRYFRFVIVCCLSCVLLVSCIFMASASDPGVTEDVPLETEVQLTDSTVLVTDPPETENVPPEPSEDEVWNLVDVNILTSVAPVTPSNSNGFKAVLIGLLGNYDPVVVEYQYQSSNGYYSYLREIQPDYAWMCGAAIFLVILFCIFRMLGGALFGRR